MSWTHSAVLTRKLLELLQLVSVQKQWQLALHGALLLFAVARLHSRCCRQVKGVASGVVGVTIDIGVTVGVTIDIDVTVGVTIDIDVYN